MKRILTCVTLSWLAVGLCGEPPKKEFVGKEQAGTQLEHFTLKGGRSYEGIWDATKPQIHIVVKANHVGNLPVTSDEILARKVVGDGSKVKIYSDVDMAEQVLARNLQNVGAAQARVETASRNRDALHANYKGKNLPRTTYNSVMAQYQAADTEVANSGKALEAARAASNKALQAYQTAGGKTPYSTL